MAVILLARALNERARRSDKTNPEGSELLDMVLDYTGQYIDVCTAFGRSRPFASNHWCIFKVGESKRLVYLHFPLEDSNAYVLYEIGDEKRLMDELEGPRGALFLLKEAMSQRENCQIYHAYALALLRYRPTVMTKITMAGFPCVDSLVQTGFYPLPDFSRSPPNSQLGA